MKLLAIVLAATLIALQYPLWFGKGGWLRVRDLQQQVDAQKTVTAKLDARNRAFDAEVRDLKSGYDALEERARSELGMIRQDEMFFQFAPRGTTSSNFLPFGSAPAPASATAPATPRANPTGSSPGSSPAPEPPAPSTSPPQSAPRTASR